MYGAILGDMIGSPYEFDRAIKLKTSRFSIGELPLQMTVS